MKVFPYLLWDMTVLLLFLMVSTGPAFAAADSNTEQIYIGGYLDTLLYAEHSGTLTLMIFAPDFTGSALELSVGGIPTGVYLDDPDQDGIYSITFTDIKAPQSCSVLLEVANWPYLTVHPDPTPTPTATPLPSDTPTETPSPTFTLTPRPTDTETQTGTPSPTGPPTFTPTATCPAFDAGQTVGALTNDMITEASGVAASGINADVLWMHNDSGDSARIYAVGTDGVSIATYLLQGVTAVDWEDMAVGPGSVPGTSYLYVADCGDNLSARSSVQIYCVPEPTITPSASEQTLTGVERYEFNYPDGAHDVETLFVDPISGALYLVVKSWDGVSPVFRASPPFDPVNIVTMDLVTTLQFGPPPLVGFPVTTGGDISPAGDIIAIRTYTSAFIWLRSTGTTIAQTFSTEPCPIPLLYEVQGESLGFAANGQGYYTLSEGSFPDLHYYARQ